MGGLSNVPNFNAWLATAWGSGAEFWSASFNYQGVIGLSFGQNPAYFLDDFLNNYPEAFGPPSVYNGAGTTIGSSTVTLPNTSGLQAGQFIQCLGLPSGTLITGVSASSITVNTLAVSTQTNAPLTAYTAPIAPVFVIQMYINLANASIVQDRWQDAWLIAMGWFVMHYVSLYVRSAGEAFAQLMQFTTHGEVPSGAVPGTTFTLSSAPPTGALQGLYANGLLLVPAVDYTLSGATITLTNSTANQLYATWALQETVNTQAYKTTAQVAAQGLANGIMVSKSVGDVSASYSVLTSLEEWGAWNLTWFGQQLATMAKVVGSGPLLVW